MKNEAKLKKLGLVDKVRYYYLKYGLNKHARATKGTATVCIIKASDQWGQPLYIRGVAFCNPADQFNRKLGRAIALGRALKTFMHGSTDPIPPTSPANVLQGDLGWEYFTVWNAKLTNFEQQIFTPDEHPKERQRGNHE